MLGNRSDTPAPRLLRVDRSARPGWKTGREQPPDPGQLVYCTEGMAEVVRVVGKTGDGSRLLELRLLEKEAPPFYAAASNVLVMPAEGANGADGALAGHVVPEAAQVLGNGSSAPAPGGAMESPAGADVDAAATDGAAGRPPTDEAVPGSGAASRSVFLDSSWALEGSFVPGTEPLPGSIVTSGHTLTGESAESVPSPAAEPVAPDPVASSADVEESLDVEASGEPVTPADTAATEDVIALDNDADGGDDADDDTADSNPSTLYIIGTPHGPPQLSGVDGPALDPGQQPTTFPLDPRVHWIR